MYFTLADSSTRKIDFTPAVAGMVTAAMAKPHRKKSLDGCIIGVDLDYENVRNIIVYNLTIADFFAFFQSLKRNKRVLGNIKLIFK